MKKEIKTLTPAEELTILNNLAQLASGVNVVISVGSEKTALATWHKYAQFFNRNGFLSFYTINTLRQQNADQSELEFVEDLNSSNWSSAYGHLYNFNVDEFRLCANIARSGMRGCYMQIDPKDDKLVPELPSRLRHFAVTAMTGKTIKFAQFSGAESNWRNAVDTAFPEGAGKIFYGFYTKTEAGITARLVIVADNEFKSSKKKIEEEYYRLLPEFAHKVYGTYKTSHFAGRAYDKNTKILFNTAVSAMKKAIADPASVTIAPATEKQAHLIEKLKLYSFEQAITLNRYQASELITAYNESLEYDPDTTWYQEAQEILAFYASKLC